MNQNSCPQDRDDRFDRCVICEVLQIGASSYHVYSERPNTFFDLRIECGYESETGSAMPLKNPWYFSPSFRRERIDIYQEYVHRWRFAIAPGCFHIGYTAEGTPIQPADVFRETFYRYDKSTQTMVPDGITSFLGMITIPSRTKYRS